MHDWQKCLLHSLHCATDCGSLKQIVHLISAGRYSKDVFALMCERSRSLRAAEDCAAREEEASIAE